MVIFGGGFFVLFYFKHVGGAHVNHEIDWDFNSGLSEVEKRTLNAIYIIKHYVNCRIFLLHVKFSVTKDVNSATRPDNLCSEHLLHN